MNEVATDKPASGFYWISGVALVWNLFGVLTYIGQAMMSPEALAEMPEAQRTLYENIPAWATGAYAIATHAGAIGCVLLLLRKSLALPVLIVSLLAILVQFFHAYFMTNYVEVMGLAPVVLSAAIVTVGVFLVWFASDAKNKGWLS